MDIVIDTSALIAVIVDEPERSKIIELTTGNTLIGPGSIPCPDGHPKSPTCGHLKIPHPHEVILV